MTERPESEAPAPGPPLPRQFSRFLLELAIGVHRYAIYPPGHPSLEPAAETVTDLLLELLRERPVLRVGVGRRQLLVEGGSTDPRNPVLGDLAHRLHTRQIAALSFAPGVRLHEVEELLRTLGREAEGDEVPLGLRAADELPSWPHARIHPLGVDRMVLTEGGAWSGARALDLWMGLAARVLGGEAVDDRVASDAGLVADALSAAMRDDELRRAVCDQLAQLVAELRATVGAEAEQVRDNVARMLAELEPGVLDRIVAMEGDAARRREFLHDVNHGLPLETVFLVVDSAARGRRRTISTPMSSLLDKLSSHVVEDVGEARDVEAPGRPRRSSAGGDLRQIVDRLLDDLEGEPGPERDRALLDALAHSAPVFRARYEGDDANGVEPEGPLRVVQTALEVGATGGVTVERALLDLVDRGQAGPLVELLVGAGAENDSAASALLRYLTGPARLRRLMSRPEVEGDALRTLVDRAGDAAVDPLLEALIESESRALRRKVFDTLTGLGPRVGERAVKLLEDPRWFVQRNMLALLHQLEGLPRGFDPLWFTTHADHRVRREAFPLALRDGASRDRAIALALSDRDERLVRMALLELRDGLPEGLLPTIIRRAMGEDRSDEIRALAVRTVRDTDQRVVRDALLALAAPGRSLFGRLRVGGASAAVVTSLEALAARWAEDRQVQTVLEQARRSGDPAIRRAAGGTA